MRIQDIIVSVKDAIEGKKKWQEKWRAHITRVKALPQDYQIVYKEIQKYLFKVGPVEFGPQKAGSDERGILDNGQSQIRSAEAGALHIRPAEIGPA